MVELKFVIRTSTKQRCIHYYGARALAERFKVDKASYLPFSTSFDFFCSIMFYFRRLYPLLPFAGGRTHAPGAHAYNEYTLIHLDDGAYPKCFQISF